MSAPDSISTDNPDPICAVCGDKANGMHYRALTCEGCKTFFRRNARHRESLKCEMMNDGGCEMDMYTRRHCAACRMQKCISVGMQPDRLWDKNRLKTRKPIQKKVKVKTEVKDKPAEVTKESPTKENVPDVLPELVEHHKEIGRLIALAYRSAKETLPQPPPNLIPEPVLPDSSHLPKSFDVPDMPHRSPSLSNEATSSTTPQTSTIPKKGSLSPKTPPTSRSAAGSSTSPKLTPPTASVGSSSSTSATPPLTDLGTSQETLSTSKVSPKPVESVTAPSGRRTCECGCIIHNKPEPENQPEAISEPSSSTLDKPSSSAPKKEIPGTAAENKQKVAVLKQPVDSGRAMFLGGSTSQDIVPQMMEIVVLLLRHMINFAKQLPGFQSLTSDDQATLIKEALVEYMILTSCPLYDIKTGQFNSDIWPTMTIDQDQVEGAGFITVMGSVVSFAVKMQKLSLTEEELALLFALAIISPDRRDLQETLKVSELQQPLVDALQTCVQINHPKYKGHFAKIIMLLTEVRNATEAYMDDLMSIQLCGNKLNPLLEELFSN